MARNAFSLLDVDDEDGNDASPSGPLPTTPPSVSVTQTKSALWLHAVVASFPFPPRQSALPAVLAASS